MLVLASGRWQNKTEFKLQNMIAESVLHNSEPDIPHGRPKHIAAIVVFYPKTLKSFVSSVALCQLPLG